ncbi:MAG TPA: hypothetical protein VNT25_03385 [Allosphingosinicella sp.]|nr:hypothetical protein [Allosphingosinicella sp.]
MKKPLVLASLLLCAACTAPHLDAPPLTLPPEMNVVPGAGLSFTVEPRTAAPGTAVTLILRNGLPRPVSYNLCSSAVEQRQAGGWTAIPSDGVCTLELRGLQPGQEVRYPRTLPATLAPGEYRFRTGVELQPNRAGLEQIYSGTFIVRR